jgi:hypothetical protein
VNEPEVDWPEAVVKRNWLAIAAIAHRRILAGKRRKRTVKEDRISKHSP